VPTCLRGIQIHARCRSPQGAFCSPNTAVCAHGAAHACPIAWHRARTTSHAPGQSVSALEPQSGPRHAPRPPSTPHSTNPHPQRGHAKARRAPSSPWRTSGGFRLEPRARKSQPRRLRSFLASSRAAQKRRSRGLRHSPSTQYTSPARYGPIQLCSMVRGHERGCTLGISAAEGRARLRNETSDGHSPLEALGFFDAGWGTTVAEGHACQRAT